MTAADSTADSALERAQPADSGWQWLSPRSLIVRPVTDLIRLLPVLAGILFFGSSQGLGHYWTAVFAGLAILTSVVRWCTTRYRITAERIYLRHGLFSTKLRSVPRDRVRSVDLTAHLVYRLLGLRRVAVGTGRSDRHGGGGLHLDALRLADAEGLRALLLAGAGLAGVGIAGAGMPVGAGSAVGAGPAVDGLAAEAGLDGSAAPAAAPVGVTELARLRPGWIRFAPFTMTGLVIAGVVLGTTAQVVNDSRVSLNTIAPVYRLVVRFDGLPGGEKVLSGAVTALILLVLLSVAGYVALFWGYSLIRLGDVLRVSRGLMTTRTTTIDIRRLRGAELSEPLLLRLVGGARCLAITTGLRVGEGGEHGGSLLLPAAPGPVARQVTASVLAITGRADGVADALVTGDLVRHGAAARRRRYVRALAGALVLIAGTTLAWRTGVIPAWTWLASLVLLPLAAALAADRYRSLGHLLTQGWLITRTGTVVRRRCVLSTDGIIGWRIHQSWFQRRQGLVSLAATTAAGHQHYVAHDIPAADAIALARAATGPLMAPFVTPAPLAPSSRTT
ncbi:MAG: PH domain-containing protein [Streptosporangiaceae bacterium]